MIRISHSIKKCLICIFFTRKNLFANNILPTDIANKIKMLKCYTLNLTSCITNIKLHRINLDIHFYFHSWDF